MYEYLKTSNTLLIFMNVYEHWRHYVTIRRQCQIICSITYLGTWSIYLCRLSYPYIILLVSWVLCQGPRADKKLSRTSSRAQAWCWPCRGPSLCRALPRTPGLFNPDRIQNIKKWNIS